MATETLRPNAPGDETSIQNQFPATGAHWDKVDDVIPDEAATYIYPNRWDSYYRDLYNLPASTGSGTINKITVFFRCKDDYEFAFCRAKASIKSNGTVTDGAEKVTTTSWVTYSQEWAVNPADAGAWEWADIDALQIGVSLLADSGVSFLKGTEVSTPSGYKHIEELRVDDLVKSFNLKTKQLEDKKVKRVLRKKSRDDYYFIINKKIRVTPKHLIWTNNQFNPVEKLRLGDFFLTDQLKQEKVKSIEKMEGSPMIYDIEVEGNYNFFAEGILTHNLGYDTDCTQVYVEVDYTEVVGTNMQVNISDVFKDISEIKVNIGDVWKDVTKIQINIGDVWKTVFG